MGSTQIAVFDGGCFWCVEAVFEELDDISEVTSGYAGGKMENPSYEQVCSGSTGHAEVMQVDYDPAVVGYDELLDVFLAVHDPTQLNRQGPNVGTQYYSVVLLHGDEQERQASVYIDALDEEHNGEVVTELVPLETLYEVEGHHQNYFGKVSTADGGINNTHHQLNVIPKIERVQEKFADKVKAEAEPDAWPYWRPVRSSLPPRIRWSGVLEQSQ